MSVSVQYYCDSIKDTLRKEGRHSENKVVFTVVIPAVCSVITTHQLNTKIFYIKHDAQKQFHLKTINTATSVSSLKGQKKSCKLEKVSERNKMRLLKNT